MVGCSGPSGSAPWHPEAAIGSPGLPAIVHVLEGQRPVEPRLTGGFDHAPCSPGSRSRNLVPYPRCSPFFDPGTRGWEVTVKIVREIQETAESDPSPTNLQASALAKLVSDPSGAAVEEAVADLERAHQGSPEDARILSDLAAAHYVRAQRKEAPFDLFLALSAADQAVRIDNSLQEAQFNLALILQSLFAETSARSAWLKYLSLDSDSSWSKEAEEHLQKLHRPPDSGLWDRQRALLEREDGEDAKRIEDLVLTSSQALREYSEQDLLGAWADAEARGDEEQAARSLRRARAIGLALAKVNGDPMIRDAVAAIDAARRRDDPATLAALVLGHRAFRDGYLLYDKVQTFEASQRLAVARQALEEAGSPFAVRAALFLACCEFNLEQYERALHSLAAVESSLAGRPYLSLLGQLTWMKGMTQYILGNPMGALQSFHKSQTWFQQTREAENLGSVHALMAASLESLGRNRDSWEHCYLALKATGSLRNPRHRSMSFVQAADFSFRQGWPSIALYFQQEVIRHTRRSSASQLADAHCWRGIMYQYAGDREKSIKSLKRAEACVRRNGDAAARRRNSADIAMAQGSLLAETRPDLAVRYLSSALAVYRESQHHLNALTVYRTRARAYRSLRDFGRAEKDLLAGIRTYDRLGKNIAEEETRLAFIEQARKIFDEMVTFQWVEQRRGDLAFAYADRAKTRALPALTLGLSVQDAARKEILESEPEPLVLDQIRRRLPSSVALVEYSVLEDRVLIWLVRRDGFHTFEQLVPKGELTDLIAGVRKLDGASRSTSWRSASADLFELLVRPWISKVAPLDSVVLIPDRVVQDVPFAALWDVARGRYLVEAQEISFVPSATLYVSYLERSAGQGARRGHGGLLAIGDPAFDEELFEHVPRLPGSVQEAEEVARLYGPEEEVLVLTGERADKASFLSLATKYGTLHFSGHAVLNDRFPLLSFLVLAPSPRGGDVGALHAWEIYGLKLDSVRLVVLSACNTGASPKHSEGSTNLARAFLAAGAPNVVASLWPVKDHITSKLFHVFHQRLRSGDSPARALREAQLSLLRSSDPSERDAHAWAAFEVVGSNLD